jgi:hypothetical protein
MAFFDWIKGNFAVPIAAAGAFFLSLLWTYIRLRMFGSRRNSKNWSKTLEQFGDKGLFKLLTKRINPDTPTTEGDAASTFAQVFTAYHYEVVGNVRFCFLRSYVLEVYAYYQWETERKLGANLMTQFASDQPMPCMGLEEKVDDNGGKYWVKVPVADKLVPELTVKLM